MGYRVKFYRTQRGDLPVSIFIRGQNEKIYAKAIHLLELLEEYGPHLKMPYAKKVDRNLYELRSSGKSAIRILYTNVNNEFYLLHAFMKKTHKTPKKEIKTALDRMKTMI